MLRAFRERPIHLLNPRYQDWDEQLLAAVDEMLDHFSTQYEGTLAERTWGEANTVRIRHPISHSLALLSGWLDMPPKALPGDLYMPRFQGQLAGASERLAVSPGQEQSGYYHMPGGQSGHPLSPFYRAGHKAWTQGKPLPFLPGRTQYTLELQPVEQH